MTTQALRSPIAPLRRTATTAAAADPAASFAPGLPKSVTIDEPRYSLRVADTPTTPCALCAAPTGAGPVGYLAEEAICDSCLLEGSHELGMLLALVAVVRAYDVLPIDHPDQQDALLELGAFARIYERFAARAAPARRIVPKAGSRSGPPH